MLLPNYYYVGIFDDEVRRFNPEELTLATINDTLMHAVIEGGPLLINDGYLMHFADGRLALTDNFASPLQALLRAGYVKLFSRSGGDLSSMPESMLHIPTYANLVQDPSWPALKNQLIGLQANLYSQIVHWPRKDTGPGFLRLMNMAFEKLKKTRLLGNIEGRNIEDAFEHFRRTAVSDPRYAARSTWNKILDNMEADQQLSRAEKEFLHWVGVESYHYNMAMLASPAFDTRMTRSKNFQQPGVLTRYSSLFVDCRPGLIQSDPDVAEGLRLRVPKHFAKSVVNDSGFLLKIVENYNNLAEIKATYQATLDAALQDKKLLPEARNAARTYQSALIEEWTQSSWNSESFSSWLKVSVTAGLGVLGAHLVQGDKTAECILGALVSLSAPELSRALHNTYVTNFQTQVPLALKLVELPNDGGLPSLDAPIQAARWSAFMPLDLTHTRQHFNALPDLD